MSNQFWTDGSNTLPVKWPGAMGNWDPGLGGAYGYPPRPTFDLGGIIQGLLNDGRIGRVNLFDLLGNLFDKIGGGLDFVFVQEVIGGGTVVPPKPSPKPGGSRVAPPGFGKPGGSPPSPALGAPAEANAGAPACQPEEERDCFNLFTKKGWEELPKELRDQLKGFVVGQGGIPEVRDTDYGGGIDPTSISDAFRKALKGLGKDQLKMIVEFLACLTASDYAGRPGGWVDPCTDGSYDCVACCGGDFEACQLKCIIDNGPGFHSVCTGKCIIESQKCLANCDSPDPRVMPGMPG